MKTRKRKKSATRARPPVDTGLLQAVRYILWHASRQLEAAVEAGEASDGFLCGLGCFGDDVIPGAVGVSRRWLRALIDSLDYELRSETETARLLFDELVREANALAWRVSPYRTLPAELREGLPEDAGVNELAELTATVQNLARYLSAAGAFPLPLARRVERASGWAEELVSGHDDAPTEAFCALRQWSEAPAGVAPSRSDEPDFIKALQEIFFAPSEPEATDPPASE